MADVKWIKLSVDFYKDRKIRQIRRKKNGDMHALIWVFLLCLAGDCNDGGNISASDNITFSIDDLADEFGTTPKVISEALYIFEDLSLISRNGESIHITNWDKHQNVAKLEDIKKNSNAERQRRYRENQRHCNVTRNVTRNVTQSENVTQNNAVDIEEDIEEDIDTEEQKKEGIYNDAYRRSTRARAASAQILTDEFIKARYPCSEIRDLYDVIYHAMSTGSTIDCIRSAAQKMSGPQFAATFMSVD